MKASSNRKFCPAVLSICAKFVLLLVGGISSCVYLPAKDQYTGAEYLGPIVVGKDRRSVLGNCHQTFMYSGTCDLVFIDHRGSHIDGFQLARELDQTGKHVASMAPWLSKSLGDESKLPYDLYLLTISPAIVLAVPVAPPHIQCGSVYAQGCIQSQGFRGKAYWYRVPPPIRAGSFWYVEGGDEQFSIDVQSEAVDISAKGAVIELSATDGIWSIVRKK